MPIPAQQTVDEMAAALDAEGNDYYLFDRDYKFAINYAINWLTTAINNKLGSTKFSEEAVRDINKTWVFQTSTYSRVNIPDTVWTITQVYRDITTIPASPTLTPLVNPEDSFYRNDISVLSRGTSATRKNADELSDMLINPFAQGFSLETRNIVSAAYHEMGDYTSTNYTVTNPREIEIFPDKAIAYVGIELLLVPTPVVLITDDIPFPASMTELILQLGLTFIAEKQGDQTNVFGIAEKDIMKMIEQF